MAGSCAYSAVRHDGEVQKERRRSALSTAIWPMISCVAACLSVQVTVTDEGAGSGLSYRRASDPLESQPTSTDPVFHLTVTSFNRSPELFFTESTKPRFGAQELSNATAATAAAILKIVLMDVTDSSKPFAESSRDLPADSRGRRRSNVAFETRRPRTIVKIGCASIRQPHPFERLWKGHRNEHQHLKRDGGCRPGHQRESRRRSNSCS